MSTVPSQFPGQYARIFVLRSYKFFFNISIYAGRSDERYQPGALDSMNAVLFNGPEKFSFNISISAGSSDERYQPGALNRMRAFSFFGPKNFSSISRFLKVGRMKGRCQRYHRGSLNSIRAFSLFGPKNFPSISQFLEDAQVKDTNPMP